MKKLYIIDLSATEREELTGLVKKGKVAAYRRRHAQILLLADQGEHGPAYHDSEIANQGRGHLAERREDSQALCAGRAGGRLGAPPAEPRAGYGAGWQGRGHSWSPSPVATRRQGGRGGPCICCAMS